jgi:putative membrane protein
MSLTDDQGVALEARREMTKESTAAFVEKPGDDLPFDCSADYPLLFSMMSHEKTRTSALEEEGKLQILRPKSNEGWIKTLFILDARALDLIIFPFTITLLHTSVYTILQEVVYNMDEEGKHESWGDFFGYVMNATLAFLLVFRLNRAATRYWIGREFWGRVVARVRTIAGEVLTYGAHDRYNREEALRWLAALPLTIMFHIRSEKTLDSPSCYKGVLSKEGLQRIDLNENKMLFVGEEVRHYLSKIFQVDAHTPVPLALTRSQHLNRISLMLDDILDAAGGMERIRGTPLPIVYVSHLRTFLLLQLNLFPYVWGPSWGWATIAIVALAAFALLGIEASGTNDFLLRCRHVITAAFGLTSTSISF